MQLPKFFEDANYAKADACRCVEMGLMPIAIAITELLNLVPALQDDYSTIWTEEQRISIFFYAGIALERNIEIHRQLEIEQTT